MIEHSPESNFSVSSVLQVSVAAIQKCTDKILQLEERIEAEISHHGDVIGIPVAEMQGLDYVRQVQQDVEVLLNTALQSVLGQQSPSFLDIEAVVKLVTLEETIIELRNSIGCPVVINGDEETSKSDFSDFELFAK